MSTLKNFASAGVNERETVLTGGDRIFVGQKIKTLMNSKVQILFLDQTIIDVGPDTEMLIKSYIDQTKEPKVSINVERGIVRFQSGALPSKSYEIKSPTALVTLEGTKVDLLVSRSGETEIVLRDGRASIAQRKSITEGNQGFSTPRKIVILKDPNTYSRVVSLRQETTEPKALTTEKSRFYEEEIPIKPSDEIEIATINPRRIRAEVQLSDVKGTRALNGAKIKSESIVRNINRVINLTKIINQQLRICSGSACRVLLNKKKMLRNVKRNLRREARVILRMNDTSKINARILAAIAAAQRALAEADAAQATADARQTAALKAKQAAATANQTVSDALQKAEDVQKAEMNAKTAWDNAEQAKIDANNAQAAAEKAAAEAAQAEADAVNAQAGADTATTDAAKLLAQKSADARAAADAAAKAAIAAREALEKATAAQTAADNASTTYENAKTSAAKAKRKVTKRKDRKAELVAKQNSSGLKKKEKKELRSLKNTKQQNAITNLTTQINKIEAIPEADRTKKQKNNLIKWKKNRQKKIDNPHKSSIAFAKKNEAQKIDDRIAAKTDLDSATTELTVAESARDSANAAENTTQAAADAATKAETSAKDASDEAANLLAQKTIDAQSAAEKAADAKDAADEATKSAESVAEEAANAAKVLAEQTAEAKAAAEKAAEAKAAADEAAEAANAAADAAADAAKVLAEKTAAANAAAETAANTKSGKRKNTGKKTRMSVASKRTTKATAMAGQSAFGANPLLTRQSRIQNVTITTGKGPVAAVSKKAGKKAKAAAGKAAKAAQGASKKAKAAAGKAAKQAKAASKKAKAAAAKAAKAAKAASKKAKAAAAKAAKQARAKAKKAAKQAKAARKAAKKAREAARRKAAREAAAS
ncbi:MAG: FecR family protein [Pseudomonadota bacterium]|nr:FecR family protein [Pseudomonadota bacterium]